MIMREEFIDKTDRRKTPKFSYVFERIYDYILDWLHFALSGGRKCVLERPLCGA